MPIFLGDESYLFIINLSGWLLWKKRVCDDVCFIYA